MSVMGTKGGRKHHTAELKAKVVIAAIKGQHTASEIASMYGVHSTQCVFHSKPSQRSNPKPATVPLQTQPL